jgi:hypothetical protein
MTTTFTSSDDIINVSDITDRVEELRDELEALEQDVTEANESGAATEHAEAMKALADWRGENAEELKNLEALLSSLCGYGGDHKWEGDWYPATLIHEDHFEYAMNEMLEDIGAIPKDIPEYLTITVNYDALKQDYSEVGFDGNTFYYR